jgi:hypothetical protein
MIVVYKYDCVCVCINHLVCEEKGIYRYAYSFSISRILTHIRTQSITFSVYVYTHIHLYSFTHRRFIEPLPTSPEGVCVEILPRSLAKFTPTASRFGRVRDYNPASGAFTVVCVCVCRYTRVCVCVGTNICVFV